MGPLVKVKGRMNSDDYIKHFSETLLSFTAPVGPELFYHPVFIIIISLKGNRHGKIIFCILHFSVVLYT